MVQYTGQKSILNNHYKSAKNAYLFTVQTWSSEELISDKFLQTYIYIYDSVNLNFAKWGEEETRNYIFHA
jgi:Zn-finger domain-containing protein